jgi:hypothetical protein
VPGRFSFAHALINHTLYEDLGTTRRALLHRRIAQALEQQLGADAGARVGELANHWAQATTAADAPKAIQYARLAGQRALEELAPDEALRWFQQALELLGEGGDPASRCELLIGLGEAQRQSGEAAFRETLLLATRIASEQGDAERATRAALANSRGQPSAYGQVDEKRVAAIERALELEGLGDPARRALLLSLQSLELVFEFDHRHRHELSTRALALARDAGDARTLARVLFNHWWALWTPDTLELRQELLPELLESAATAGDPGLQFWSANVELHTSVEGGELERAEAAAQRMVASAEQQGEPTMRWTGAFNSGAISALRGDLARAERVAERALKIGGDAGQPDAYMVYAAQIAQIRLYQGRGGELIELLEQGVATNPRLPAWRAALAQTLCWLDRSEEAAAIVVDVASDGFAHIPWNYLRPTALALYAEAASLAGVRDAAGVLYELIEPWREQVIWNGAITYGHARTYLGMLAAALDRDERADEHFELASEFHEANALPMWAARTHLGWAEALVSRGDSDLAQEEAARALELSREHGYGLFEPRAAAILEAETPAKKVNT